MEKLYIREFRRSAANSSPHVYGGNSRLFEATSTVVTLRMLRKPHGLLHMILRICVYVGKADFLHATEAGREVIPHVYGRSQVTLLRDLHCTGYSPHIWEKLLQQSRPRRSWICLGCLFSEGQKVGTAQRSQWSPAPQRAFLRFFGSLLAKFLSEGYFQQHYWHLRMMPYPSPFQEKP